MEKVNESLDAIKKAYESRITALTEIPAKLQEYPNPREEKFRLAVHQQMIRDTQSSRRAITGYSKRTNCAKAKLGNDT